MIPVILEAAFRSLLMAAAVWAGIRMLRVQAVLAQKLAWVMVLLAAGTMPLAMRAPIPIAVGAVQIPARSVMHAEILKAEAMTRPLMADLRWALRLAQPLGAHTAGGTMPTEGAVQARAGAYLPKPRAGHHALIVSESGPVWTADAAGSIRLSNPAKSVSRQSTGAFGSSTRIVRLESQSSPASLFLWLRNHAAALLTLAYFSVAVFLLFRTLAGLAVALCLWLRSRPVPELQSMYLEGQTRTGSVRASRDLATPVTIGSTVILPADYREWDEDKLRIVLAHERSHVRQGDFYLQLLAAAHVAVFWFSPLGWWLKRKLSELGEALSDRAGLEAAPDASTYAQVLLEFAAMPRTAPVAGVPMARSGSLSARIDRILNISRLKPAFAGGKRHVVLSASLVLTALMAAVACIRIVPPVEAGQAAAKAQTVTGSTSAATQSKPAAATIEAGELQEAATGAGQDGQDGQAQQVTGVPPVPSAEPPAVTIAAPEPEPAPLVGPAAPAITLVAPPIPATPKAPYSSYQDTSPGAATAPGNFAYGYSGDDDDNNSFAIIRGNGNVTLSGHAGKALEEAKRKYHNNFLWFERDGRSYVITDPSIMDQFNSYDQRNKNLERQQAQLQAQQDELSRRMKDFDPNKAGVIANSPEMKKQMAELNRKLAELQGEKFKKMTDDINKQVNQEMLSDLQSKMGEIQAQIGELQGRIGEEMGRIGEKQGELGEQMGRLGEQMGRIGEEQGKLADEMNERVQSLIDRAMQNGTAKPVN